jgi:hypothetical protein
VEIASGKYLLLPGDHIIPNNSTMPLCYDGVVHEHGGQAPGREDRAWTLSQWWIKRLPCCANGTV